MVAVSASIAALSCPASSLDLKLDLILPRLGDGSNPAEVDAVSLLLLLLLRMIMDDSLTGNAEFFESDAAGKCECTVTLGEQPGTGCDNGGGGGGGIGHGCGDIFQGCGESAMFFVNSFGLLVSDTLFSPIAKATALEAKTSLELKHFRIEDSDVCWHGVCRIDRLLPDRCNDKLDRRGGIGRERCGGDSRGRVDGGGGGAPLSWRNDGIG